MYKAFGAVEGAVYGAVIEIENRLIALGLPTEHKVAANNASTAVDQGGHALHFPENGGDHQTEIAIQGLAINTTALQVNQTWDQTHLPSIDKTL